MKFIGTKKVLRLNRIGLPSLVIRELGFVEDKSVYVYINGKDVYISGPNGEHEGFPVKCDPYTGRVGIPEPIRTTLQIGEGDELDIYVDIAKNCVILKKRSYVRDIELVKELAITSKLLDADERRTLDILLDILMDEERGRTHEQQNKDIKSK